MYLVETIAQVDMTQKLPQIQFEVNNTFLCASKWITNEVRFFQVGSFISLKWHKF